MRAKAFRHLPTGVVRATSEHMPFAGHRTCAEWMGDEWYPRECKTDKDRRRDAVNGSEKLRRKSLAAGGGR